MNFSYICVSGDHANQETQPADRKPSGKRGSHNCIRDPLLWMRLQMTMIHKARISTLEFGIYLH